MSAILREAGLLKELEAAKERIRQLEAQSVAVVGEPVAWVQYRDHSGMRPTTIHLCDSDSKGAFEVIRKPTHSIHAAELATLREKAVQLEAERSKWQRNSADNLQLARDMIAERDEANARLHDVSVACATAEQERDELQKRAERMQKALSDIAEWTDRYTTPGHPVSTIARAALAQGKGE